MKKILNIFAASLLVTALSACSPVVQSTASPTPSLAQPPATAALDDYSYDEPFFSCAGTGDDVVQDLTVDDYSFLKVTHLGSGHFSIWAYYGDESDLLINTISPYNQGCVLLNKGQEYTLEIKAENEWTLEAHKLGTSSSSSFCGSGDCVTPIFVAKSDIYEIKAEGDGHFAVWGYHDDGSRDLLVNTIDTYSGRVMFRKATGKYTFFEITGERDWTILSNGDDEPLAVGNSDQNPNSGNNDNVEDSSGVDDTSNNEQTQETASKEGSEALQEQGNETAQTGTNDDATSGSEQAQENNSQGGSWITQEQEDKITQAQNERKKNTFMLAIVQDDFEEFLWNGKCVYETVWKQLYIDYRCDVNQIWQAIKADLDIYNTFGESEYTDLWVITEAIYGAYESGALKETMSEEEYQQLIDNINKISNRLGIFYASKEIADANS